MKDLIIIGAGGFGRTLYNFAKECPGFQKEYSIKGFLDDNMNALDNYSNYPCIISKISDYDVQKNDVFICSIGSIKAKKQVVQTIEAKGGEFLTLIHPTAHIGPNGVVGKGSLIMRNAFLGSDSVVGSYTLIQNSSIVGHDVKIGDFSRLDCHVVCVGGTVIGDEVTIHTSAVINHKVVVGSGALVGACSFVIRKVKEGTTVFGNPAKKL